MTGAGGNVADFLLDGKDPSRAALLTTKSSHTYGEMRDGVMRIAAYLAAHAAPGDRIVLIGDNSFFWVAAYLGILKAGLTAVPLPVATTAEDFSRIQAACGARIVFADAMVAARQADRFAGLSVVTASEWSAMPSAPWTAQATFDPASLAALMFTSGSTGEPRGVMVTHRNIQANTESIATYLALTPEDRCMVVLPFHYCFGTSLLHTHLHSGGSLVLDLRFRFPETILQRMIETECTGFAGVPSHYQILLRNSSLARKQFPRLRLVQQAGGCLAPVFIEELRAALPGVDVFVMYGQTEATSRLSYLPPDQLDRKMGSIGKGIPGVTLEVVNEAGAPVEPGQTGQITARGENITAGYWNAPADSAEFFRDGKLYTGDMATVDEEGYIFISGRQKDFVKSGGRRVSCRQIEEQLIGFPELLEAAVIGVPDVVLGEAVKAFVVPRVRGQAGLVDQLLEYCRVNMTPHLIPKEIVVLDALPKNSAGKVLKERLRVPGPAAPNLTGSPA
jgi:acyl-CoA synthetase (AMP-forming)/AMP-acid ligase II